MPQSPEHPAEVAGIVEQLIATLRSILVPVRQLLESWDDSAKVAEYKWRMHLEASNGHPVSNHDGANAVASMLRIQRETADIQLVFQQLEPSPRRTPSVQTWQKNLQRCILALKDASFTWQGLLPVMHERRLPEEAPKPNLHMWTQNMHHSQQWQAVFTAIESQSLIAFALLGLVYDIPVTQAIPLPKQDSWIEAPITGVDPRVNARVTEIFRDVQNNGNSTVARWAQTVTDSGGNMARLAMRPVAAGERARILAEPLQRLVARAARK